MRRLLTPGWFVVHVLAVAAVVFMLWLAWWQLTRGMEGNSISWGYAFQWPVFAGFAVFIWVREARRALYSHAAPSEPLADPVPVDPAAQPRRPVITRHRAVQSSNDDPELAAYNRYLQWLNAHPGARPADFPG